MAFERILVSGGAGFAGSHLVTQLQAEGVQSSAPSRAELDFRDRRAVREFVRGAAPSAVIHLAAFSSPSRSWEQPAESLFANLEMTMNVLEAVRQEAPTAAVVLVGSGQVYGEPDVLPVAEDAPLRPGNPYAVSKASGDLLGRQYAEAHGLKVVRMRPFNHAGPGQSDEYVVSALARQIAEAEIAAHDECVLRTGNPDAARDFTDVRDVVRAYIDVLEIGTGVFNVCSGIATSVADVVGMASAATRVAVRHEVDPSRLREHDMSVLCGSHDRLSDACGWQPEISLEQTVRDALGWWRSRLKAGA